MDRKRRLTVSIGPLGMSLAAAAVTAAAFAAISLADSGNGGSNGGGGGTNGTSTQTFMAPAPPGGIMKFRGSLSDADRQKLEDFQTCMKENGAPAPPDPGEVDPNKPPRPLSAANQDKLQKAWEACKDKLPQGMQNAGPPQLHAGNCAPPPGVPAPGDSGKNQNHDQRNDSSSPSSGS